MEKEEGVRDNNAVQAANLARQTEQAAHDLAVATDEYERLCAQSYKESTSGNAKAGMKLAKKAIALDSE